MDTLEQQAFTQAFEKLIDSHLQQHAAEIVRQCKPDVSGFALKTDLSGLALKAELEAKLADRFKEFVSKFNEGISNYHVTQVAPITKYFNENSQKLQQVVDVELKNLKTMLEEKDKKIQGLLNRIADIESDLNKHINAPQPLKNQSFTAPASSHNFNKETLEKFNEWAKFPTRFNLNTSYFSYISGDFQVRTVQKLTPTNEPTAWIVNKTGPRMLLPNPNFLDRMRDISELYGMDQNRLKPKGQNSLRITKPCLMADTGFIEFPGELELF
jgi:hypothetical protein